MLSSAHRSHMSSSYTISESHLALHFSQTKVWSSPSAVMSSICRWLTTCHLCTERFRKPCRTIRGIDFAVVSVPLTKLSLGTVSSLFSTVTVNKVCKA